MNDVLFEEMNNIKLIYNQNDNNILYSNFK